MNTNTTTNQGWEAFAKAARELGHGLERLEQQDVAALMNDVIACVRPIAADEIDAADVAADLFMLHAFIARSRVASQKADPPPTTPTFTSQFARGITRRLRLLLVSLSKSMTDPELRQLGAILGTLDHGDSQTFSGTESGEGKQVAWDAIWDFSPCIPTTPRSGSERFFVRTTEWRRDGSQRNASRVSPRGDPTFDTARRFRGSERRDVVARGSGPPKASAGGGEPHAASAGCLTDVSRVYNSRCMPSEPTTLVAVRLPDRLIGRVERHAKRLSKEQRGVTFTRSDAIRDLLTNALDRIERPGDDQ